MDVGFVFVHGAELGAWVWDEVVGRLRHPAVAVDLPGRGSRPADPRSVRLDDGVRALVDDARTCEGDRLVVVAHSFSGVLVPPAVHSLEDRVAAVVFVAAAVPDEGKGFVDLLAFPQRVMLRLLYRIKPGGMLSPDQQNRDALCNDLDEAATTTVLGRRVVEAPGLLLDPVSPARLPATVARHYVRCTDDRSASPASRQQMIDRLAPVEVHDLDSGHLPMLSRPDGLVAILDEVAGRLDAT